MKYIITDTSVIRLSERAGTIQNLGGDKVELSDSADFASSFVLPALNTISFSKQLYARIYGVASQPVELNVVTFAADSGGNSGSSSSATVDDSDVTTDDEANEYFDSIFGGDNSQTVDDEDVASDDEADEYFDSIFGGLG